MIAAELDRLVFERGRVRLGERLLGPGANPVVPVSLALLVLLLLLPQPLLIE